MQQRHATPAAAKLEAEARLLVGTPWKHLGRDMAGMDHLGVVHACAEAAMGRDLPCPDDYRPGWKDDADGGLTVEDAELLLTLWGFDEIGLNLAKPGDVILFAMPRAHLAVMTQGPIGDRLVQMVHAYWGRACVASWLGGWWRSRAVRAYRLHVPEHAPVASNVRNAAEQVAA